MSLAGEVGELFAAWGEAAEVALVVTNAEGMIEYASDECRSLCGRQAGDHLNDIFLPADLAKIQVGLRELNASGSPVDQTAHLHDGETIARFLITRVVGDSGDTRAMIAVFRDITAQGLHELRLEYEIDHDDLTGVLSRAAAMRILEERYERGSDDPDVIVAVLFVDLDDFKGVNDGYGHLTGDEVLKVVAERLKHIVGDDHRVARIGGDEFLIVLGGCRSTQDAVETAHVVAGALGRPVLVGESAIAQRFSIGVAVDEAVDNGEPEAQVASSAVRVERLLAEADVAMYVAKHAGTSIAVADESTRTWSTRRLVIDRDLFSALEAGSIDFFYQPIVDLERTKWVGAEALLRWHHPQLGLLPPELVVERAEVIGCIDDLTRYTIETVTNDWAEITRHAPVMLNHQVAINASARQLNWEGFVDTHLRALSLNGLTPPHLLIEVTESSRIELHQDAALTLNQIADHGVRIVLDDFGVGYSALSYFTQFTVHGVKVDRSLVSSLRGPDSVAEKLLRGVVRIADDLGARVVGEGIESEVAAWYCRSLGMAIGQGWHFGEALPRDEFVRSARTNGMARVGDHVVLPGDPQLGW